MVMVWDFDVAMEEGSLASPLWLFLDSNVLIFLILRLWVLVNWLANMLTHPYDAFTTGLALIILSNDANANIT